MLVSASVQHKTPISLIGKKIQNVSHLRRSDRKISTLGRKEALKPNQNRDIPNKPQMGDNPYVPPPTSIKTWVDADLVFKSGPSCRLVDRKPGIVETSYHFLSTLGIATNTIRVYRMEIFIVEDALNTALKALQSSRSDLKGTIPEDGPVTHYVDFYPSETESESQSPPPYEKESDSPSDDTKKVSDDLDVELEPISVSISNGDKSTWLAVANHELNTPFFNNSPLLRVHLVRSLGGTDMIITAHQALLDELSMDATCHQILDLYDIASEGRLNSDPQSYPLLWNTDIIFPSGYHTMVGRSYTEKTRVFKQWQNKQEWLHLPWNMEQSPENNISSAIFSTMNPIESRTFVEKCQKAAVDLPVAIEMAFLKNLTKSILGRKEVEKYLKSLESKKKKAQLLKDEWNEWMELQKQDVSVLPELFVVGFNSSLRKSFDPEIAPQISGPLNTFILQGLAYDFEKPFWEQTKLLSKLQNEWLLAGKHYEDLTMLPVVVDKCAISEWNEPGLPNALINPTTIGIGDPSIAKRFKLKACYAATSCWAPGVSLTSQLSNGTLNLGLTFRKPLIAETEALEILKGTMNTIANLAPPKPAKKKSPGL